MEPRQRLIPLRDGSAASGPTSQQSESWVKAAHRLANRLLEKMGGRLLQSLMVHSAPGPGEGEPQLCGLGNCT